MSIRTVQTERLLADIVRTLFSQGEIPLYHDVAQLVSAYFAEYPAGLPLPMPLNDAIGSDKSSVDDYNQFVAHLAINLDVLYENSFEQIEQLLQTTSSLESQLKMLEKKRDRLEATIDDYLLSLYNTDGYFYSFSDNFADLQYADLDLTTAEVHTESGTVLIPSNADNTKFDRFFISDPSITVTSDGQDLPFEEISPITGAFEDSLENTIWGIEVKTTSIKEIVATVEVSIGTQQDPVIMSALDFVPFGSRKIQLFVETRHGNRAELDDWVQFGNKILTSDSRMAFAGAPRDVRDLRFTMRKTEPDYVEESNGKFFYRYIFGSKAISIAHKRYDAAARFVSAPLGIPDELSDDMVIDSVSLDVDDEIPEDTEIHYYVASSSGEDEDFADLDWKPIVPIGSSREGNKTITFNGANRTITRINEDPEIDDLQLIPLKTIGQSSELNPTNDIVSGVDIYRIANLPHDNILLNSISLIEGFNTTRILSKNIDTTLDFTTDIDLDYWADVIGNQEEDITTDYGQIDAGDEFFYGGDIGATGKDIYVETFLESDITHPVFLEEFTKLDPRSRTWDIKVFLNGRPMGDLPVGVHTKQLPWSIRQGLNHVVLLIRIEDDATVDNAFLGSTALMTDSRLYDFGIVRLDRWNYVNLFSLKYNEQGEAKSFTIIDNEIVSRKKPTTNFRVSYATSTNSSPDFIRFRAELSRSRNTSSITPKLNSYRIRYAYAR